MGQCCSLAAVGGWRGGSCIGLKEDGAVFLSGSGGWAVLALGNLLIERGMHALRVV